MSGYLTYKEPRVNEVFVYNPVSKETVLNQVGLTGLKPTVLPSSSGVIKLLDVPFFSATNIGGNVIKLDNLHTMVPEIKYNKDGIKGGHNEQNFNNYILDNDIRMRVLALTEF